MAQSYLRSPSIQRLPELMEWLQTGELRIPAFQREVVWTGDQRLSLCDTILRGLPAGSVMVWRTTRRVATGGFSGPFHPPTDAGKSDGTQQYLLDGQQRLTTLFAALGPALWTRVEERPPWRDERRTPLAPDSTPWMIGFDLTGETGFLLLDDTQDSSRQVLPLHVLLDDTEYDDWRDKTSLDRRQKNRAREIRSAFVDYQLPVVPLATDDLDPVVMTFKRVNRSGTSMGDFDMVRALSWSDEFDLGEILATRVLPRLENLGWGDFDRDALLKVIATAYGMAPVEVDWERLSKAIGKDPSKFKEVSDSLNWAVKLLAEIGFGGPATLPYTYILVFAARVWQGNQGASLSEVKEKALKKWLVEAGIGLRFSGAPPHVVQAAWRELEDKLSRPRKRRTERRAQKQLQPSRIVNFGWARPVVTAAVLASLEPLSANGKRIRKAAKNLGQHGRTWYPKLLEAPLQDSSPRKLHLTGANRLVCGQLNVASLRRKLHERDCPQAILTSHAITRAAHQCLVRGDVTGFLAARFVKIIELENAWLKSHGSTLTVPVPVPE